MSNLERRERLARLLVEYCREHNLSGAELGLRLDVSQQSAHRYMTGVTYPQEDVRKRMAKLFGLTAEEFQAKLDGETVKRKLSPDDLAREIRLMSDDDFALILPVVFERIHRQLTS